ncbi:hypothetical protein LP420_08725 [Massilia sp. B-10]|nr:hypothetical protein LP420_08725 [Massilia sp. B-10]
MVFKPEVSRTRLIRSPAPSNPAREAQTLVATGEHVARVDECLVFVEEFDPGQARYFDVDEDRGEGAGGRCRVCARLEEGDVGDVAVDRGEDAAR